MQATLRTPITSEFNQKHKARLADFHGWLMPTFYTSILEEHKACRQAIGLFDVSHMGRWWVTGKDAEKFLDYLTTNDIAKLQSERGIYTAMLNEAGGIIDDLIIYKINSEKFFLVNNAGNHEIDAAWYLKHSAGFDVKLDDVSPNIGQIAIQGPQAKVAVEKLLGLDESLKYFSFNIIGDLIIAATGYTGEKGYELYAPNAVLMKIWEDLISQYQAKPCGLGARDLLRLEAGYCLHGNDIDTHTSPYEAGLDWVTKLDKKDFIGKAHAARKDKKLVGLLFPEGQKIIPRAHTKVLALDKSELGEITSGNLSPMLNTGIALAYIKPEYASSSVIINIRDKEYLAEITKPWFYRNI